MLKLNLQKLPLYVFSSNRQFMKGEKHICRIYDMSVLILMRKGVLNFNEDGKTVSLKKGEYYIQRPFLYQEGVIPSNQPNYYFIHFQGEYSEDGSLPLRGSFDIEKIQEIIDKFDELQDSGDIIEHQILFFEILLLLKRGIGPKTISLKIKEYILNNYSNEINLDDLCKISFLSKNQVINVFKKEFGLTPHQFLIEVRLKKACEMIITTDESLKEIGYKVGFTDYTIFYKTFIRKFGYSPNGYRWRLSNNSLPEGLYNLPDEESGITFN